MKHVFQKVIISQLFSLTDDDVMVDKSPFGLWHGNC